MYWNCGLGICSPRTEGTRDAPLRTSAWEAMLYSQGTDHLKTYQWSGGGGREGGEVQKKMFAQGKFKWQKIHARQLTLQNIHATAWKIHTRNLITKKKNSCDSKIPHPSPTTFLMVRPWNTSIVLQEKSQSGVNQFVVLWPVFCCDRGGCGYICTYIRRQVECTICWG